MDKIHHLALQVNNIEESLNWYKQQFEFKVSYQDESWALLDFENVSLALVLPGQHPPHFAIVANDATKYGALVEHRDGTKSIYINDPSGNAVEMLKLPEEGK